MKISQREAKRLRQRVEALEGVIERQRRTYSQEWFMGANIATVAVSEPAFAAVRTARLLSHGVVIQINDQRPNELMLMALPQPKDPA